MTAISVRPKPRLLLSEELRGATADDRPILMAELFASSDILSQSVHLPLDFEINVPQAVGGTVMAEDVMFELPVSIRQFRNGLVEIKPGVLPNIDEHGSLTVGRSGPPTDPILHLPLLGETLCILHNDVHEGEVALGGIVSLRDDDRLYEPHQMIYWDLPTFSAVHHPSGM